MARTHKDNLYDQSAYCPFWRGTRNHISICCEGPYKRTHVQITFATGRRFEEHRKRYCYQKECEQCRIYQAVMTQYEEEMKP